MKKTGKNRKLSLTNNIGLKFLAVFIALVLWLAIVNIDDPEKMVTVTNIPISMTNEKAITDRDMVYNVKSEQYVNITVSGKRSIVGNLTAEDFRATASLRELSKVNSVPVEISAKNSSIGRKITIVKQSAQTILVDVENVEEREFDDIDVEYTGKVADGYVAGVSSLATEEIVVKAPVSVIEKIKKVVVRCSLDGANEDFSKKCPVVLYDKKDREITSQDISLSDKKIKVDVRVLRAKQIPIAKIDDTKIGKPADGYVIDGIELYSDTITVYGEESALSSIEELSVQDEINVADAKGDVIRNIDVAKKMPNGVSVSGESTITVKVIIKKLITRTFEIDGSKVDLKNVKDKYDAKVTTKKVKVTLQGEEENISQLSENDIKLSANLSKIKSGNNTVKVKITLPENIKLKNDVTVKINAKEK